MNMYIIELKDRNGSYFLKDYLFSPNRARTEVAYKIEDAVQFHTENEAEAVTAYLEKIRGDDESFTVSKLMTDSSGIFL